MLIFSRKDKMAEVRN